MFLKNNKKLSMVRKNDLKCKKKNNLLNLKQIRILY